MPLNIANVIRVTLLSALRGLQNVNTSALAIITDEVPIPGDFGTSRTYLDAIGVAEDFGSNSDTARLAEKIFGQVPNILTGKGYLVVIPRLAAAADQPATIQSESLVDFTALTATDYNLNAAVDGGAASDELIGTIDSTDLASITTSLNSAAITAAGLIFSVSGEVTAARVTLSTISVGAASDITLAAAGTGTDIAPLIQMALATATGAATGLERVKDAVLRTQSSVNYFGIVLNEKQADADLLELASLIQTMDKLLVVGSSLTADITVTTGVFSIIKDSGYTHTRTTLYTQSASLALDFAAGYASRGLSTNFDGSNTAQTMHLKEIVGFVADDGITQTFLDAAVAAGTDTYVDFGIPKLFTSGANTYWDQIYSQLAFKTRLQIAGFNYLAQTTTKIPQTEDGMNGLKSAYRDVCILFVTNGTFAPGAWTGSTTFGLSPEDHIRNIAEQGYFIYSSPIATQSSVERTARIAPLVQIAGKDSGAIHSSDVTVFIEA